MSENSQWALLKKQYFAPLFFTQFLGALNDNLFKNALIILLTFNTAILPKNISEGIAVNISAGLFILPYFIFSAWAGELADKYEKSKMIQYLKIWEIGIISIGILGLYLGNIYWLWATLFGLGIQATFFGPLKYSILPQHLKEIELVGGNALIESGTFIAILIGTILGGILIQFHYGWFVVGIAAWSVAVFGYISARFIPLAQSSVPELKVGFNIIKQTFKTIIIARNNKTVFRSILGISWFWFFGATLLSQFPALVKDILGGNEHVVTLLLAIFSIGIGIGSLLCEKMSGHKIEIGLVPFGAIGLSIFCFDLYFTLKMISPLHEAGIMIFIQHVHSMRLLFDFIGLSIFGGFFMVPLYALIQSRSEDSVRSRIIAANNIMNSAFMVISALFAIVLFSFHFSIKDLILYLAILNTLTAIYIFTLTPEFLLRFIIWLATHTIYRIKKEGLDNIQDNGKGIIICNHVSFIDALIIFGSIKRPVKFVMYYKIFNIPVLKYIFNAVGAIPIASKQENPEVLEQAYKKIKEYLINDELVVIFPEGKITQNGELNEFKSGVLKINEDIQAPIYPSALIGLFGSMYSRKENSILRYFPKSFMNRKIIYKIDKPYYDVKNIEQLQVAVFNLMKDKS